MLFGCSNRTCIDPTWDPKNEDQSQECVHCIGAVIHMRSAAAILVAMIKERRSLYAIGKIRFCMTMQKTRTPSSASGL